MRFRYNYTYPVEFLVQITRGTYTHSATFLEEKKARDYYTDALVRFPDAQVELIRRAAR